MKVLCKVVSFVTICLLVVVGNAQAITIDSLHRDITLFQNTAESNLPGVFDKGLSWANGTLDDPYNANRGVQVYGAQGYQNSSIEYDSSVMTAGGIGGLRVWLPSTDNINVIINSRFDFLFTPLTGASYNFFTNNDGGFVTFTDMATNDFLYDGSGNLVAGRQYRITADARISAGTDPSYGLNSGSYWNFRLEVNEIPTNTPVPEPSTLLFMVSGLVGIVAFGKRRWKA
jgi:hypothetical protein